MNAVPDIVPQQSIPPTLLSTHQGRKTLTLASLRAIMKRPDCTGVQVGFCTWRQRRMWAPVGTDDWRYLYRHIARMFAESIAEHIARTGVRAGNIDDIVAALLRAASENRFNGRARVEADIRAATERPAIVALTPRVAEKLAAAVEANRAWNAIPVEDTDRDRLGHIWATARAAAVMEFAASRSWTIKVRSEVWHDAGRPFSIEQLRRGDNVARESDGRDDYGTPRGVLDHCEYYKVGNRPVALLSHTYVPWSDVVDFAFRRDLRVERLPLSWYFPDKCIAALFTSKGIA